MNKNQGHLSRECT